ncbi:MAG: hypothetical protein ACE5HI_18085 [bacterium]
MAIKRVLTAEQLKKLETLKRDRVKKRARRIRNLRFKRLYRNLQNFERDLEPDEMKPESGEAKRKMIEI